MLLVAISLFFGACDSQSVQKTTNKLGNDSIKTFKTLGVGVQVKFIQPPPELSGPGSHWNADKDVQRQLESFVNDSPFDVVDVVVNRCDCNYSEHFLGAEVYYLSADSTKLNNKIKIKIIQPSPTLHNDEMNAYVQGELEAFINGGQYEIARVETNRRSINSKSYLVNAEVYYRNIIKK